MSTGSTGSPKSIADIIESFRRMLTVEDLVPLLTVSPKTLYKRVKGGTMPATLIGGAIRLDPYLTAQWLREQTA